MFGAAAGSPIGDAIGGALFGFAVKSGWVEKLPAVPVIGRTGTAAFLLHYWGKNGGGEMVRRVGRAAAIIAGYQLGSTGAVTGDQGFSTMGSGFSTMGDDDDDDGDE